MEYTQPTGRLLQWVVTLKLSTFEMLQLLNYSWLHDTVIGNDSQ